NPTPAPTRGTPSGTLDAEGCIGDMEGFHRSRAYCLTRAHSPRPLRRCGHSGKAPGCPLAKYQTYHQRSREQYPGSFQATLSPGDLRRGRDLNPRRTEPPVTVFETRRGFCWLLAV